MDGLEEPQEKRELKLAEGREGCSGHRRSTREERTETTPFQGWSGSCQEGPYEKRELKRKRVLYGELAYNEKGH